MVTKISDTEAKYKVADEKIESIDEEYSNKFEDMKEAIMIVLRILTKILTTDAVNAVKK